VFFQIPAVSSDQAGFRAKTLGTQSKPPNNQSNRQLWGYITPHFTL